MKGVLSNIWVKQNMFRNHTTFIENCTIKNKDTSSLFFHPFVDGGWSEWSNYGECSATCGKGSHTRNRKCNSPLPSGGGSTCSGESLETKDCEETRCPGISFLTMLCIYKIYQN